VSRVWFPVAAAIALHSFAVHAQTTSDTAPDVLATNLPLKSLGPGTFELGKVHFDKNKQEITFPGAINMDRDLIEYAVVHSTGKVHESLLRTDAEPYHIHLAILLVRTNANAVVGSSNQAAPRELLGAPVSVRVSWKSGNDDKSFRLEDLIFNSESNSAMTQGGWIYNGSRFLSGTFVAQRDGSIMAIISDPDALINNPRQGRENDEIWQANHGRVPTVGTPVTITIQLEKSGPK
jgi:hypothetical protein